MNKIALLEEVASEWNRLGVEYAVAHGIDDYPVQVGRDLDVLVRGSDIRVALGAAQRVLESHGLAVGRPPEVWGLRLITALDGDTPDMIEIHLVRALSWTGAILADHPRGATRLGPFVVDPWASFVKRVMLPVLSGNTRKLERYASQRAFADHELQSAYARLPALIGASRSAELLEHLERRDIHGLRALAPSLRRALSARGITRHPGNALVLLVRAVRRKVAQPFSPCAPIVAVAGAPGTDRMAVIRRIAEGDLLIFTDCIVRRPDNGADAPRPSTVAARSGPRALRSVARRATLTLRDRAASMRQRLVLYDGGALDTDAPPRGNRHAGGVPARPDLLILLVPDSARDGRDTPRNDAAVARDALATRDRVVRIDPGMPPDALRNLAMPHIARAFVRKNQRAPSRGGRSG